MIFRVVTVAAVLLTWFILYLLDLTRNAYSFLIPLLVLAVFQALEKRYRKK